MESLREFVSDDFLSEARKQISLLPGGGDDYYQGLYDAFKFSSTLFLDTEASFKEKAKIFASLLIVLSGEYKVKTKE